LIFREQAEEERREKSPCHFCKEGHSRGRSMDVETWDRRSSSCGHHSKILSIQNLFHRRGCAH
jgi:hypothetical protein